MSEMQSMSAKALRRRELEANRKLAEAAGDDPGRGLPPHEAQAARDERVQALQAAKAEREAARAELASRERPSWKERFAGTGFSLHKQAEEAKANRERFGAERAEFHSELKAAQDAKNAAELQRRRDLGLLYEPVGEGGGLPSAALFSSSLLWAFTERKIQEDGVVGQILDARSIVCLWWCCNLIQEHGGEAATFAAGTAPHWPDDSGEIPFREADIAHLERNGFIEVERQLGAGGSVTYRFGPRTRALVKSYRKHLRAA